MLVRVARLGEPAERLAQAVAVLGDRAPLRQARRLAGLDAEPAEQAADALAGAHILASGEPLSFTHPLIATSVLADIPAFARSRAHRRAADLLAADGAPPTASPPTCSSPGPTAISGRWRPCARGGAGTEPR